MFSFCNCPADLLCPHKPPTLPPAPAGTPSGLAAAMAEHMLQLLNDPAQAQTLGRQGRVSASRAVVAASTLACVRVHTCLAFCLFYCTSGAGMFTWGLLAVQWCGFASRTLTVPPPAPALPLALPCDPVCVIRRVYWNISPSSPSRARCISTRCNCTPRWGLGVAAGCRVEPCCGIVVAADAFSLPAAMVVLSPLMMTMRMGMMRTTMMRTMTTMLVMIITPTNASCLLPSISVLCAHAGGERQPTAAPRRRCAAGHHCGAPRGGV
jgi:hypothetical protein